MRSNEKHDEQVSHFSRDNKSCMAGLARYSVCNDSTSNGPVQYILRPDIVPSVQFQVMLSNSSSLLLYICSVLPNFIKQIYSSIYQDIQEKMINHRRNLGKSGHTIKGIQGEMMGPK